MNIFITSTDDSITFIQWHCLNFALSMLHKSFLLLTSRHEMLMLYGASQIFIVSRITRHEMWTHWGTSKTDDNYKQTEKGWRNVDEGRETEGNDFLCCFLVGSSERKASINDEARKYLPWLFNLKLLWILKRVLTEICILGLFKHFESYLLASPTHWSVKQIGNESLKEDKCKRRSSILKCVLGSVKRCCNEANRDHDLKRICADSGSQSGMVFKECKNIAKSHLSCPEIVLSRCLDVYGFCFPTIVRKTFVTRPTPRSVARLHTHNLGFCDLYLMSLELWDIFFWKNEKSEQ